MKNKYIHLAMLLILCSAVAVCAYHIYLLRLAAIHKPSIVREVQTLPTINVSLEQLALVKQTLLRLVNNERPASVLNLQALGYVENLEAVAVAAHSPKVEAVAVASKQYELSMIAMFSASKYCVINNDIYQEGDRLAANTLIKQIEPQRVLLVENQRERWIALAAAVNQKDLSYASNSY